MHTNTLQDIGGVALFYDDTCVQLVRFPHLSQEALSQVRLGMECNFVGHVLPSSTTTLDEEYSFALSGKGPPELSNFVFQRQSRTLGIINNRQELWIPQAFEWNAVTKS